MPPPAACSWGSGWSFPVGHWNTTQAHSGRRSRGGSAGKTVEPGSLWAARRRSRSCSRLSGRLRSAQGTLGGRPPLVRLREGGALVRWGLGVRFFRHLPTFLPPSSHIAIRSRRSEASPVRHFLGFGPFRPRTIRLGFRGSSVDHSVGSRVANTRAKRFVM